MVEIINRLTGEVRHVESAREQKLLRLLDLEERRLETMKRISRNIDKSPNIGDKPDASCKSYWNGTGWKSSMCRVRKATRQFMRHMKYSS